MNCFSCIITPRTKLTNEDYRLFNPNSPIYSETPAGNKPKSPFRLAEHRRRTASLGDNQNVTAKIDANSAHSFTFRELAVATRNFRESYLIGEGGFGKVYKGRLDDGKEVLELSEVGVIFMTAMHCDGGEYSQDSFSLHCIAFCFHEEPIVATKKLSLDGFQGNQEFIVEVLMLSLLHHPNLVTLIGYCAEGEQRLLVYEYMSKGSLADHLFDIENHEDVLDWNTRIKIAAGAARGLQHLHCIAKPPVIYRDLKSANILLDKDFNPKLSDFGLAKLGPVGDNTHVSTRVMGTYGYCAPEYALSGKLTLKSDIFCFGVVLLEIVTGRKAYDLARKQGQQSLAAWARPFLRDRKRYIELVDPRLKGKFPSRSARHLIAITAMCLNEEPNNRPSTTDIVVALDFLANECLCPSTSSNNPSCSSASQSPQHFNPLSPNEHTLEECTSKEDLLKENTMKEDSL